MKTEGFHSAYPTGEQNHIQPEYGITKREYFAAMAMQGMLARNWDNTNDRAKLAVEHADALIEALNK